MKALIFAAGLGTRLKPLTETLPKALVPIGGKPLLQWQIEKLREAGITDITVNVHHLPELIIDFLHQNKGFGCTIHISDERDQLLETGGGAYKVLQQQPTEPLLCLNVDILSTIDIPTFVRAYHKEDLGLLVVSERQTQRYLCFDESNRLKGWTNIATGQVRPASLAEPYRRLAFSGMQILSPRILPYMAQMPTPVFSLIDLYLSITEQHPDEVLRAYIPSDYRMMDIGKIDHLAQAEMFASSLTTNDLLARANTCPE